MSHSIASMLHPTPHPLNRALLRTAGIVQAIVALPCTLYLAGSAYNYFNNCYDEWYYFTYALSAHSPQIPLILTYCSLAPESSPQPQPLA